MDKANLLITKPNLVTLTSALVDLAKISDIIKLKFDKETLFVYALVGETAIIGFKNYSFKIKDIFETDFEEPFDFILIGAKKFVKNLNFFEGDKTKISFTIKPITDGTLVGRILNISDGTFKITQSGGEIHKIKDITKKLLDSKFPIDLEKPNIKLPWETLQKIKRISANTEEVVTKISIKSGKVIFSESNQWSLNVGVSDYKEDIEISFDNGYLGNINQRDEIHLFIYDTVIMFDDNDSKLLVAFEEG